MKKINKISWFNEGLQVLEICGPGKITIDGLCTRLGVTKGSFYHHFENMESYIAALMEYWLETHTLKIIEQSEAAGGTADKRKALNRTAAGLSYKAEQSIRAWGYFDAAVRRAVEKSDEIRLHYLINLYREAGMKAENAKDAAMLEYATLIGIQQLFPNLGGTEMIRLQHRYFMSEG